MGAGAQKGTLEQRVIAQDNMETVSSRPSCRGPLSLMGASYVVTQQCEGAESSQRDVRERRAHRET